MLLGAGDELNAIAGTLQGILGIPVRAGRKPNSRWPGAQPRHRRRRQETLLTMPKAPMAMLIGGIVTFVVSASLAVESNSRRTRDWVKPRPSTTTWSTRPKHRRGCRPPPHPHPAPAPAPAPAPEATVPAQEPLNEESSEPESSMVPENAAQTINGNTSALPVSRHSAAGRFGSATSGRSPSG